MASPRFSPKALAFLRALKRNNDREWFRARREQYDVLLRAPMLEVIAQLERAFRDFAPDLVASPAVSLYRIYRDTRFSHDKRPLKTHVAAVFPRRGLGRHQGAGLYFEVAPDWVWIGGGLYAPDATQLYAVREHIASHHRRLTRIVGDAGFRRHFGALGGDTLQRVPRGFPADHPAAAVLKHRQFLVARERPAALATSPRFYGEIVSTFKAAVPLVEFRNEPLV